MLLRKISVEVFLPSSWEPLALERQWFLSFYRSFAKRQVSASPKEQKPVAALDA